MPKKEKYTSDLICHKCNCTGKAEWEENANPVHAGGKLDTRLISVSDGFIKMQGNKIICKSCNGVISKD